MQARRLIQGAIDKVYGELNSPINASALCGNYALGLRFASAALAQDFMPSFIVSEQASADLEIFFASREQIDLRPFIPDPEETSRVIADDVCYAVWMPGPDPILLALDRDTRRAIVWLASGSAPAWVRSRPGLSLIHAMSIDTSWTATHGGSVGLDGRFVLLAGRGFSGKTTAALACAAAGWDYAGDDYVLVNTLKAEVRPLYSSARLRSNASGPLGSWIEDYSYSSVTDGELRHELSLNAPLAHRIRGGELVAIFLPRRLGATRPVFTPARRSDAFNALLASTMIELPGWPKITTEKIASVAGIAPVYFVDTGTDPDAIPDAFAKQLDEIGRDHDSVN